MAHYKLTKKAVEDLTDIWNFTYEKWSEQQADKYYLALLEGCKTVAENNTLAKNYDEIDSDIFGYLVNKHILFFMKTNVDEILIVRILHASSELKSRIND